MVIEKILQSCSVHGSNHLTILFISVYLVHICQDQNATVGSLFYTSNSETFWDIRFHRGIKTGSWTTFLAS